jgi:guanyl-specific ribonuclease Sa
MRGVVRFFKGASDDLMATVAAIVEALTPGVRLSKETQQRILNTRDYIDNGTQPSWANQNWGDPWRNDGGRLPTNLTYTEYAVQPPAGVGGPGELRMLKGVDSAGNARWWYSPDHWTTLIEIIFK